MSITQSTKSRPFGTRFALISAVSLGLIGGPVALAVPADASTSLRGCTVDPLKPTDAGKNLAEFKIRIHCNGNKIVDVRQKRFERDRHGRDDRLGSSEWRRLEFNRHDERMTLSKKDSVEKDKGKDRVYQEVSFRVKSGNNWSDWTQWERSDVAVIR
ncbi:hypothetical protein JOE40_002707 [Arthrobacter sp. PvP102]|uniref:hypothetical protein n=1 Tax=unclassified Arthrobacter TaxID=235627 RepID=UPI001AE800DB|nr:MULTISPECIES: hypothetical protein [unclassified Arthrobacter]MBP1233063.1 hypothetical protein [Arthrobacter sp. PvP103]MBP1238198.1 hypothetical protein [Arthrobacter sp. PvP102]